MSEVTIEGSILPCAFLPRGERRTVQRTDFIDKLIARGYVVLIEEDGAAPAVVGEASWTGPRDPHIVTGDVSPPPGSALKGVWADFLDNQRIPYEETDTKADLIRRWDERDERG